MKILAKGVNVKMNFIFVILLAIFQYHQKTIPGNSENEKNNLPLIGTPLLSLYFHEPIAIGSVFRNDPFQQK